MNYKDMKIEDIIDWCKTHQEVEWLKETASKPYKTKDGKTRNITFIELKLAFVKKFMPEIAPEAKPKKPTMYELIANL